MNKQKNILTIDMGGTKTDFFVWTVMHENINKKFHKRVISSKIKDISQSIRIFLDENGMRIKDICAMSFSLAGVVSEERCKLTNLDYEINFKEIKTKFSEIKNIYFVNDTFAIAKALECIPSKYVEPMYLSNELDSKATVASCLQKGVSILAPGTGLGSCAILKNKTIIPLESQHSDFAATSDLEWEFRKFILKECDSYINYEDVLSGNSISKIWQFINYKKEGEKKEIETKKVIKLAIEGDKLALKAIDFYLKILGNQSSNMAITNISEGAIVIAGGMAVHLAPFLKREAFKKGYFQKYSKIKYLEQINVFAINCAYTSSFGAAVIAMQKQ